MVNKDGGTREIISVAHDNPEVFVMHNKESGNLTLVWCVAEAEACGWHPAPEPAAPWRPEEGEWYWYVSDSFAAGSTTYIPNSYCDAARIATGNCFRTKEEAEAMAEKFKKILQEARNA